MKEFQKIINKYFNEDGRATVYYYIAQEEFAKMLHNMKPYEQPDILSIYDDKIVAIEHFEFDSYKKSNSKGSDFQIKHSIIDKRMHEFIQKGLKEKETVVVHDKIDSTASLTNYYNNFKTGFISHYNKIESYRNHIISDFGKNKKIEFWFFIEDVSPLGSYFQGKDREIYSLNPLYSNELVELLKNSKKIKGIILGQYAMSKEKLTIIINNKKNLDKFQKENESITQDDFFFFEPQTTGFATLIPKKDIEGVDSNN